MWKSLNIRSSLSASLLSLAMCPSLATANATCNTIPAAPEPTLVTTCETAETYIYQFPLRTEEYAIAPYRTAIQNLIQSWLRDVGADDDALGATDIEIWLSVPDTNPDGAQLRVLVKSPLGNFVTYLDFAPELWSQTKLRVGILADELYPQAYGYEAGKLLVKVAAETTDQELARLLQDHVWQRAGNELITVECQPFAETATREQLLQHDPQRMIIKAINYNYWFEWLAFRGKAFTFPALSR